MFDLLLGAVLCTGVRLQVPTPIHVVAGRGSDVPAVVRNEGTEPVTLVMPGDGSENKRRTPHYEWIVLSAPAGADLRFVRAMPICGNINPIKRGEVFTLSPGEQRVLSWIRTGPLLTKGEYRLRLVLENNPSLEWASMPLGRHDEAEMEKVRASTPCVLEAEVDVISK